MQSKRPKTSTDLINWSNRHGWLAGCDLVTEQAQARDEGRDLRSVDKDFARLNGVSRERRDDRWLAQALALIDRVQTLPIRRDYAYVEPSDLAAIKAARPPRPALRKWGGGRAEFLRRLHGGWLGRICGCMLGKPVEGKTRQVIRLWGEQTDNWPLHDYFRLPTKAQHKRISALNTKRPIPDKPNGMLSGYIRGMVEDDDTNYTATGFAICKQKGADFTPLDVASFWMHNIPIMHTCTAERIAYRNFVVSILPPRSATHRNPCREWIGAQIRADYFGYANPGNPARAAEWAWRDASISHIKNGIYGEMWVAAMLAAAYVETDWGKIIRAGLAQVPAKCRLREDIEQIVAAYAAGQSYDEAVDTLHGRWNELSGHDWCHTNSNAQIVAIGLLYGEDDFEQTIARAVMPALDTDCNGATCGSLWGVKHGVDAIPRKWSAPMRDTIRTGVAGYHEVRISKMAEEMVDVAIKAGA